MVNEACAADCARNDGFPIARYAARRSRRLIELILLCWGQNLRLECGGSERQRDQRNQQHKRLGIPAHARQFILNYLEPAIH